MNNQSISKMLLILEIKDKFKVKCELKRHLSPALIGKIYRDLPLNGNSHIIANKAIYIETSIESGLGKTKREFKKGDITYLAVGHAICFFYTDTNVSKDMTYIGRIIDEPEQLKHVTAGDEIRFYEATGL
jgi:hypothetical protein